MAQEAPLQLFQLSLLSAMMHYYDSKLLTCPRWACDVLLRYVPRYTALPGLPVGTSAVLPVAPWHTGFAQVVHFSASTHSSGPSVC